MPSNSRNKRHYPSDEDEGVSSYAASRGDKSGSDPYARSNYHARRSDKNRPASPSRADMRDDAASSSSRTHRERDDRYDFSYQDGRRGGKRDDYDTRARDAYSDSRDTLYSSSRKQYGDSYDYDRDHDNSNHDPSAWTPRKENKDYGRSRWGPKDGKESQRNDRGWTGIEPNDKYNDSRSRDDPNPREWHRDNGWASRRVVSGNGGSSVVEPVSSDRLHDSRSGDSQAAPPASSTRQQDGQRKKKKNKKAKTDKRPREWRTSYDDTHLNNWTRRDSADYSRKGQRSDRKYYRSASRSPRSRSPAESYYSRRSSRGRSRSSETPRRRRADSWGPRSRSPHDRPGKGPPRRWSRSPSRSPLPRRYGRSPIRSPVRSPIRSPVRSPWSPEPHRRRSRGRSLSTASSISRSPSRSPRERARTVHRLPLATSAEDLRMKMNSRPPGDLPPRAMPESRNGDNGAGKRKDRKRKGDRFSDHPPDSRDMPPPSSLPPSSSSASFGMSGAEAHGDPVSQSLSTNLGTKGKKGGFKPIAPASSSLKRFFPGDEDEEDSEAHSSRPASNAMPLPPSLPKKPTSVFTHAEQLVAKEVDIRIAQNGTSYVEKMEILARQMSQHPMEHQSSPMAISPPQSTSGRASDAGLPPRPDEHFKQEQRPTQDLPRRNRDNSRFEGPFEESVHAPEATMPPTPEQETAEFYKIVSQVGEGTFGKVYKAKNTNNGRFVALKRIRMETEKDGFPVTAMREIKLLQSLRHGNVIQLYEMMVSNGSVFMVFEYMDHDLTGILSQTQFSFTDAHLKSLCQQMLAGLAYLHHKGVIHRDIKGSNILVNNRGELKLGDFGLARFYQKRRKSDYTNRVITLWYRPPELLFGTTVYGPEVDMWSAGCIMLELFTKKPIFQGNDEIHQLDVVYKILGTPTPECWPGVNSLPWYELVKPKEFIPNHFRELFQKWLSPSGLDLAEKLLAYDPAKRISALEALQTPYFLQEQPPPDRPVGLATLGGEWHELDTKRERAKKRRKTENSTH